MRLSRRLGLFLFVGVLVGSSSCSSVKTRTVVLLPESTSTVSQSDSDHAGFPCVFLGTPTACSTVGADPGFGRTRVGYAKAFSSGFCWAWVSCKKRGYMTFDLAPVTGREVVAATLRYRADLVISGGIPMSCARKLYLSGGAGGWESLGEPISSDLPDGPANFVPVNGAVRDWAAGRAVNHGFVFVGSEDYPNERNDQCLSVLHDFTLEVQFRE